MFASNLPNVPSVYCAANVVDFRGARLSATGIGPTLEHAYLRMEAEMAERKSLHLGPLQIANHPFEQIVEPWVSDGLWSRFLSSASEDAPGVTVPCTAAMELATGECVLLPRKLLLARRSVGKIALGHAAARDRAIAVQHAVLELVERTASARPGGMGYVRHNSLRNLRARILRSECSNGEGKLRALAG